MARSLIIAFIGPRGGGKTSSAAGLAALHMMRGGRCYSNLRIVAPNGQTSEDVSLAELASFDEKLLGAWSLIDELPVLFNSRVSMSVRNRIMGMLLAQSRKRQMSFLYTAQNFMWVDAAIRYLTDVVVSCKDMAVLPQGREEGLHEGQRILWRVWDHSGLLTGYPGSTLGYKVFNMGWTHDIYNTFQEIDVWDAFAKVEVRGQRIIVDPYGTPVQEPEVGLPAAGVEPFNPQDTDDAFTILEQRIADLPRGQQARQRKLIEQMRAATAGGDSHH